MRYRIGSLACLVGVAVLSSTAVAQHTVASGTTVAGNTGTSALKRLISIHLDKVRVKQAVEAVAAQANVRVQYQEEQLNAAAHTVSLRMSKRSLGDALGQILAGTQLHAVALAEDLVTIKSLQWEQAVDGVIVGKVIHAKTKQPVVGITVTLDDQAASVTTSADGSFRLTASVGEHAVRVRGVGLMQQTRRVNVVAGEAVVVEFVVEPSASVLDEVIVTGTVVATQRKEIATPITVIHGEELEKRGITRIEQLFRGEVPGLLALDRGAATYSANNVGGGVRAELYSRGSADVTGGANPIKTYVDGVELLDPSYLGTLDPSSIDRIEIVTGPQAATIYGSGAMGGVMQIFTRKGQAGRAPVATLQVKYGMLENNFSNGKTPAHYDQLRLDGGLGAGVSYSASVSHDYTGQWQPKLFNRQMGAAAGLNWTSNAVTVNTSFSTTATTRGTWNGTVYGLLQFFNSGEGDGNLNNVHRTIQLYSEQVSTSSNQTIALNADYRATRSWQHHITVGRTQNVMTLKPVAPNFVGLPSDVGGDTLWKVRRLNGQRLTWNYNSSLISESRWLSSALTMGINGSMGEQLSVNGNLATATASTIVTAPVNTLQVTLPLNDRSWGAFGQWRLGLLRQLYATLGLRAERNPNYGREAKVNMTPTNGLTYTLEYGDVSFKMMGSYGRATRAPQRDMRLEEVVTSPVLIPGQYVRRFANPELRPEHSRGPQGGFELYYGNLGFLTLNTYRQTITDLIQNVPVDSVEALNISSGNTSWQRQTQYLNVAKVRQTGWEGTAGVTAGMLRVKGAYSWNNSRVLASNPRVTASNVYKPGQAFKGLPERFANISATIAQGTTTATIVANYVGQSYQGQTSRLGQELQWARLRMYQVRNFSGIAPGCLNAQGGGQANCFRQAYAKFDLSGNRQLTSSLAATLNVTNVGNRFQSDDNELNPTLGRQTLLGLSYRFGRR